MVILPQVIGSFSFIVFLALHPITFSKFSGVINALNNFNKTIVYTIIVLKYKKTCLGNYNGHTMAIYSYAE